MKLSKQSLIIATTVPLVFGVLILYNFISAINILRPVAPSTAMIYSQLYVIGLLLILTFAVYWCIMMYLIYLLQENLLVLDKSLDRAADVGAKHLSESKNLLNQVINILKRYETVQ